MTVNWQPIALPFNQGVDTKSDAKALQPPKLAVLENGEFTERGSIRKRRGARKLGHDVVDTGTGTTEIHGNPSSSGGSAGSGAASPDSLGGRMLATRADELLLADGVRLFSYSAPHDGWIDKGQFESVVVDHQVVAKVPYDQRLADYAEVGGIGVYAWEGAGVFAAVVDAETGAVLIAARRLSSSGIRPRVVAVNGFLHVLWAETAITTIKTLPISPANLQATMSGAAKNLVTDLSAANPLFDVAPHGERAAFAYMTTAANTLAVAFMSGAGAVLGIPPPRTFSGTAEYAVALAVEPTSGEVVVCWSRSAGGAPAGPYAASFSSDLAAMLTPTNVENLDLVANLAIGWSLPGISQVSGAAEVWRALVYYEVEAASKADYRLRRFSVGKTTAGNVEIGSGPTADLRHAALASKAFRQGDFVYVNIVHDSPLQTTYFTMRQDGAVVARMLPGVAGGVTYRRGHLPAMTDRGAGVWRSTGLYKLRLESPGDDVFTEKGIQRITLDFASERSYRRAEVGATLYIAGGLLHQYDGEGIVESGFHLFVEGLVGASETNGAGTGLNPGATANQKHTYSVYPEWTNARGERELGTLAALLTVTVTNAAHNAIRVTIRTLSITAKKSPRPELGFAVYRTEKDPGPGAPRYRVSSVDPAAVDPNGWVTNDPTVDTIDFIDKMPDSSILSKELDYQNSGELDHVAPPAAPLVASGKDRVFVAGAGQAPCRIYPSKLRSPGQALAFSDALAFDVDEAGGGITGLAVMNELLIVFKRRGIYALSGDGPSNLGSGAWARPQMITADTGCDNPRSIVMVPGGLMFQSEKGIYLLTQALGLEYVGADVEAYNADRVTAALVVADRNQVLFVTDAGRTLCFDYLFRQWAVWTFGAADACVWKGQYAYALASGQVRAETVGFFKDGGALYAMKLETAWIRPDQLQRRIRVRRAHILGDYHSAHRLQVDIAFDYGPFVYRRTWDPATGLSQVVYGGDAYYGAEPVYGGRGDGVYQFRFRLPRQKVSAVKFAFTDIPSAEPGESYELTELALEVGLKEGLAKLPSAKTLG